MINQPLVNNIPDENSINPCVVSLQMQLDAANNKIAELEAHIAGLPQLEEPHNLRQQAKGLHDCSEYLIADAEAMPVGLEHSGRGQSVYNWQTYYARELRGRANRLTIQADRLEQDDA